MTENRTIPSAIKKLNSSCSKLISDSKKRKQSSHKENLPNYQIIWQNFREPLQNNCIYFKARREQAIVKTTVAQLENNVDIIGELDAHSAFALGEAVGRRKYLRE